VKRFATQFLEKDTTLNLCSKTTVKLKVKITRSRPVNLGKVLSELPNKRSYAYCFFFLCSRSYWLAFSCPKPFVVSFNCIAVLLAIYRYILHAGVWFSNAVVSKEGNLIWAMSLRQNT